MLGKYKFRLGIVFGLLVFLLVCIAIPFILDWKLYNLHLYDSHLDSAGWSSFNGSYIGAIIGGIATLLGVFITLVYTDKKNRRSELRENSFIVYYDLYFALKDLKRVFYQCRKPKYKDSKDSQSLIFSNKEWNKNIAKLSGYISDIKSIYELYGYLEQVSSSIKKYNDTRLSDDSGHANAIAHARVVNFISAKIFNEDYITNYDELNDEFDLEYNLHGLDYTNELQSKYTKILEELRKLQKLQS